MGKNIFARRFKFSKECRKNRQQSFFVEFRFRQLLWHLLHCSRSRSTKKNQHKTNNNGEEKREGKIKEKYFIVVQCNDFTTCSTSMIILLIFIRISFRCALGIDMTVDGWSHVDSIGRYFARIWYAASCGHVKLQVELLFYWQFPLHIISSLWPIPMCCVGCCCCCGKIEQLKERKEKKYLVKLKWNCFVVFFSVYFSHFSSLLLSHRTTTIHTNKC